MKNLINNEGKTIQVSEATYNALKASHANGVWMAMVKDVSNNTSIILLPENF